MIKKFFYRSNILTAFLSVIITISFFYLLAVSTKVELDIDESLIVPISSNSVAFPIYVDGTKCIVTESVDHGAISCDWNKRH